MAVDQCPCGSNERYRLCCRPYHRGDAEPADCSALVRARFSAFDRREIDFLVRTVHSSHEDRAVPEQEFRRSLKEGARTHQYVALHLLDVAQRSPGETSRVLLVAELFERGKDRSFIEASDFLFEGGGWRYARGDGISLREFKGDWRSLTLHTFAEYFSAVRAR